MVTTADAGKRHGFACDTAVLSKEQAGYIEVHVWGKLGTQGDDLECDGGQGNFYDGMDRFETFVAVT